MEANKKLANRYGLNLKLYAYGAETSTDPIYEIPFANEITIELSSDVTWATGYQDHRRAVGFNNPIEGTMTLSTQLVTMELLNIISGGNGTVEGGKVVFANKAGACMNQYFKIVGDTVWVDEEGKSYTETVTLCKACAKRNYNVTYTGDGEPTSLDVEFELTADDAGTVMEIEKAEATA